MIIGVDIDGVLTNLYEFVKKRYKKYFKNENIGKIDKSAVYLYEYFGYNLEQDQKFWKDFIWEYAKNAKFYKTAGKYLKKLKEDGHQIYIITMRTYLGCEDEFGKRMSDILESGFKKNEIVYDKLFALYSKGEKLSTILENKVDIMIDDDAQNLIPISKHIPTICFEAPYNKSLKLNNMYRCKNWKEIYNYISNINKK